MNLFKSVGGVKSSTTGFPPDGSGANPTPALQNFKFRICKGAEVTALVKAHHYTHSTSGVQYRYAFVAELAGTPVGGALFGQPAMPSTWKKYASRSEDLIELRRLIFIDSAPRNIESRFIGFCLRWLKKNTTLRVVLSYADPFAGHSGTIYKAANFKYLGQTASSRMILWRGKLRHSKSLQAGRKTEIRPYSFLIRAALKSGDASYVTRPGKHIFLYKLQ
jgi:hypothetical protein